MIKKFLKKNKKIATIKKYLDRKNNFLQLIDKPPIIQHIKEGDENNFLHPYNKTCIPVTNLNSKIRNSIRNLITLAFIHGSQSMSMNQTGEDPYQIFVIAKELNTFHWVNRELKEEDFKVYINPEIIGESEMTNIIEEYCASHPNQYAKIVRSESIEVTYLDSNLRLQQEDMSGILARVFQHEMDHMQGMNFLRDYDVKLVQNLHLQSSSFLKKIKSVILSYEMEEGMGNDGVIIDKNIVQKLRMRIREIIKREEEELGHSIEQRGHLEERYGQRINPNFDTIQNLFRN